MDYFAVEIEGGEIQDIAGIQHKIVIAGGTE